MLRRSSFFLIIFWSFSAFALAVDEPLSDKNLELRAQSLFRDMRCVVCQSETIADSHAAVASDMRRDIRKMIESGVEDAQIKADLVSKYGDVILMKPPLKTGTYLLWFGPWIVLCFGTIGMYFYFCSSKKKSP